MIYNFTRVQSETTKEIKEFFVNGNQVTQIIYNNTFNKLNSDLNFNYCNSATKQNIKTGDYIHTAIFTELKDKNNLTK
jgi:hypothetical protein